MNLSCGIVGLPNVGKSTLFNALLGRQVANVANYPFCTIDPNVGVVPVPDERLLRLAEIEKSQEIIPAVVEFVDIAGLVKGAHKGEGLGNKFLSHIREVSLIVQVLRDFNDENIIREGSTTPQSDYEVIKTELLLADLQTLEKQQEPKGPLTGSGLKEDKLRWEVVLKLKTGLGSGLKAADVVLSDEERLASDNLCLLTAKPEIVVLNVSESEIAASSPLPPLAGSGTPRNDKEDAIRISAKIEEEISALPTEERKQFMAEINLNESALEKLIKTAYDKLRLVSFLTAGPKEARAWTIEQGTKAPQAAAVIHTDFEKAFIKAKVCSFDDFVAHKGWLGVKESGKMRLEGKEYVMQEGDVVEFVVNA